MIAGPFFPSGTTKALGRAQDVVSDSGGWTVLLPQAPVSANGYDRRATTIQPCRVAALRDEGTVARHSADFLIRWDLGEKV